MGFFKTQLFQIVQKQEKTIAENDPVCFGSVIAAEDHFDVIAENGDILNVIPVTSVTVFDNDGKMSMCHIDHSVVTGVSSTDSFELSVNWNASNADGSLVKIKQVIPNSFSECPGELISTIMIADEPVQHNKKPVYPVQQDNILIQEL